MSGGTKSAGGQNLLRHRRPRSRLDLMYPDLVEKVLSNQMKQKAGHDHNINVQQFVGHAPKLNHTPTGLRIRKYTGEPLKVLGVAVVNVVYKEQQAHLQLLVVKEQGPCLLGWDWLRVIKLDWSQIHMVQGVCSLQHLLSKHECIFKEELGTMKGVVAEFVIA